MLPTIVPTKHLNPCTSTSSQKMTMGTFGHTPSAVFICQRASFQVPAPSFVQCLAASPSFYGQFSLTLMPL